METSADTGRDLWKQIREQISECELRAAEKNLELQEELREQQLYKDSITRANKEISALRTAIANHGKTCGAETMRYQALTKEKSEQQLETGRLLHQVELLTKKLREQEAKLEAERAEQMRHIAEQQEYMAQLQQLLTAH